MVWIILDRLAAPAGTAGQSLIHKHSALGKVQLSDQYHATSVFLVPQECLHP